MHYVIGKWTHPDWSTAACLDSHDIRQPVPPLPAYTIHISDYLYCLNIKHNELLQNSCRSNGDSGCTRKLTLTYRFRRTSNCNSDLFLPFFLHLRPMPSNHTVRNHSMQWFLFSSHSLKFQIKHITPVTRVVIVNFVPRACPCKFGDTIVNCVCKSSKIMQPNERMDLSDDVTSLVRGWLRASRGISTIKFAPSPLSATFSPRPER